MRKSAYVAVFVSCVGSIGLAQQSKVFANDGSSSDNFGCAVDLSGDTAIVGAQYDDDASYGDVGAAYVYRRIGGQWVQEAKLTPSDAYSNRYFGDSVAIDGNVAVVGSRGQGNSNGGGAYVFRRTGTFPLVTWTQEAKLSASDTFAWNEFGASVAIEGNTIAVGCPNWSSYRGAAYLFKRTAGVWSELTRVSGNDSTTYDYFGKSIALDANSLVVGAPGDDVYFGDDGSAFVFVDAAGSGVWIQQQKLSGWLTVGSAQFGSAVDLVENTVVIGAPYDRGSGGGTTGAAYLYRRVGTSWGSSARLLAGDEASDDGFGSSVSLSSTFAIVGAPRWEGTALSNVGALYVFAPSGGFWIQSGLITATDVYGGALYGTAVALDGSAAIAGAAQGLGTVGSSGAAYVLESVVSAPLVYCTGKLNSLNCTPAMTFNGSASYNSPSPFLVGAQQVLSNKYGFLIYSKSNSAATPFQGGYLCIQSPVQRTPTQDSAGAPPPANNCTGVFNMDFNAHVQSGVDPQLLPGLVVWCQYWYRDPSSPSTTGLSNGLQFVIGP